MSKQRRSNKHDFSHHGLHHFQLHYEEVAHIKYGKRMAAWLLVFLIPAGAAVPVATYQYLENSAQSVAAVQADQQSAQRSN